MNKLQPGIFRSLFTTVQYLFLPGKDPAHLYWSLGVITLIGMVLRLLRIDQPIAYDEAYTFLHYATRGLKTILADYSAPNNHIFHSLLVSISYLVFGDRTWVVRIPAFLAGTLCIPAAYFAARRTFALPQSLAAAALVALTPWFIDYSANGRGYTLVILFSLLLANVGALLIREQSWAGLAAYAITSALGFYTIPIFLYPMAGISLWVLASHLATTESWRDKSKKAWTFLAACAAAGVLVFLLYSPVIFFGTGLDSITSNEFVESRDGAQFVENLRPRALRTWESWMIGIPLYIQVLLAGGFLASMLFYRQVSSQRLPLPLFLVLAIVVLLAIQQVAPLARVWMYLEAFYMIFAGAGLVWLAELILKAVMAETYTQRILPSMTLIIVVLIFLTSYREWQRAAADRDRSPEQYTADFLAAHLQGEEKILSVAPVDIQTAYYLHMNGVPYEVFYRRDHPQPVQNAIVLLRTGTRYNSPESVLDFYSLTDVFTAASARLLFEYGPVHVYSIPSR